VRLATKLPSPASSPHPAHVPEGIQSARPSNNLRLFSPTCACTNVQHFLRHCQYPACYQPLPDRQTSMSLLNGARNSLSSRTSFNVRWLCLGQSGAPAQGKMSVHDVGAIVVPLVVWLPGKRRSSAAMFIPRTRGRRYHDSPWVVRSLW